MRIRTLSIWKRFRPLWLALIGWLCCSVIMVCIFGYHLLDLRGGLPKVDICREQSVETDIPITALRVHTDGIGVEIAAAADIRKPVIQLYGSGYINQRATWTVEEDGTLCIALDPYPVTANVYGARNDADALMMRILLPGKSYDRISVEGNRLNTLVYGLRAKELRQNLRHGSMQLQFAKLQTAELTGQDVDISVERCNIRYMITENDTGSTSLLGNTLPVWQFRGDSGDVQILTKNLKVIWDISTVSGDITIGTKTWSQELLQNNLLLQLHSDNGLVKAASEKKPWKKLLQSSCKDHELILLQGIGSHIVKVETAEGNIVLETARFNT